MLDMEMFGIESVNIKKEVIQITEKEAIRMQELLDMDWLEEDFENEFDTDSTYYSYTFKFDDGMEADIKVCCGQHNFFLNCVLFDDTGREADIIHDAEVLLDEYEFEHQNGDDELPTKYIAILEVVK